MQASTTRRQGGASSSRRGGATASRRSDRRPHQLDLITPHTARFLQRQGNLQTGPTTPERLRLKRSSKHLCESSCAQRCSLVCHPSTRCSATCTDSDADAFTPDLPNGVATRDPAGALPHATGFPGLGVLRRLRHVPSASADSAPCSAATATGRAGDASRVHCDPLDRIGIWLYPCSTSGEHSQHLAGHHARIAPSAERTAR
jgi:hypothetical protein